MATSKVVEVALSARALRKMGKQTTVFAHVSVSHGRAIPLGFRHERAISLRNPTLHSLVTHATVPVKRHLPVKRHRVDTGGAGKKFLMCPAPPVKTYGTLNNVIPRRTEGSVGESHKETSTR